jgi:hypothetical protein
MKAVQAAVARAEKTDDPEIRVEGQGARSITAALIGAQRSRKYLCVVDTDGYAAQFENTTKTSDRRDGARYANRPWEIRISVGYSHWHEEADRKIATTKRSKMIVKLDGPGRMFVYWPDTYQRASNQPKSTLAASKARPRPRPIGRTTTPPGISS